MSVRYLKIKEFAQQIGVSVSTLRNWEERGWLIPHHKTPAGYRIYTNTQVEQYFNGSLLQKGGEEVVRK